MLILSKINFELGRLTRLSAHHQVGQVGSDEQVQEFTTALFFAPKNNFLNTMPTSWNIYSNFSKVPEAE